MPSRMRVLVLTTVLAAGALAGCGPSGAPRIRKGMPCARCGMAIQDLRFACAWDPVIRDAPPRRTGPWRVYDAIECLVDEMRGFDGGSAHDTRLADYDRATLHRGDSMWVVSGDFPSPMGGGLAAFLDPAAADTIAAATRGRVVRLHQLIDPERSR